MLQIIQHQRVEAVFADRFPSPAGRKSISYLPMDRGGSDQIWFVGLLDEDWFFCFVANNSDQYRGLNCDFHAFTIGTYLHVCYSTAPTVFQGKRNGRISPAMICWPN